MKLEKVSLKVGLTINTGNYESARVDVGGEVRLEGDDSYKEAFQKLAKICEDEMNEHITGVREQIREKNKNAFAQ